MLSSARRQASGVLRKRWRAVSLQEASGSLGDLGTFLPLLLNLAAFQVVLFSPALFWAGFYNVATGLLWDTPMPVQPMKTISAVALASGDPADPGLTPEEVIGAGLSVGTIVFVLGVTGFVDFVNWVVPLPVVRGLQLGLGASMVRSGLSMAAKLPFAGQLDCVAVALVCTGLVLGAPLLRGGDRFPTALLLTALGFGLAGASVARDGVSLAFRPGFPVLWNVGGLRWEDVWNGFLKAGLAQLPLTTLNSVVSVCDLNNNKLFPGDDTKHVSRRSMASSVGLMNLTGLWFGAMPMCHGAGGLAAQYRFGARSGTAVLLLGAAKMLLAVLLNDSAATLLAHFPTSILGVLLSFAGLGLALAGIDVPATAATTGGRPEGPRTIMMATALVTLTFRTGWGFLGGMLVAGFYGGFDHIRDRVVALIKRREQRAGDPQGPGRRNQGEGDNDDEGVGDQCHQRGRQRSDSESLSSSSSSSSSCSSSSSSTAEDVGMARAPSIVVA